MVETSALFSSLRRRWTARWKAGVPLLAVVLLAGATAPWLIAPACPTRIVIGTGGADGAYYAHAQQYREILARDGIHLEIRETAGSLENLQLLQSPEGEISLAFVQGGVSPDAASGDLQSLASVYYEPVWLFFRHDISPVAQLTDVAGLRIAVGSAGSGTRAIALRLLEDNGIGEADEHSTRLLELSGRQAADALREHRIDAAFLVMAPSAQLVRDLLAMPEVRLMNFARAGAYVRRHPYLAEVTLEQGIVDLQHNLPAEEVTLLAPTAGLVVRSDFHPALVPLLLQAADEVHSGGGLLAPPGRFPSPINLEHPLNVHAKRYFNSGPSLLYRYLPFSLAATADRMKLLLLPLCTLLLPLIKVAPPVYRWRIRYRIFRWYRVLRDLDQKLIDEGATADFSVDIRRLQTLETELAEVSVPLSYMEEFYNLRLHVEFIRKRLEQRQQAKSPSARVAA